MCLLRTPQGWGVRRTGIPCAELRRMCAAKTLPGAALTSFHFFQFLSSPFTQPFHRRAQRRQFRADRSPVRRQRGRRVLGAAVPGGFHGVPPVFVAHFGFGAVRRRREQCFGQGEKEVLGAETKRLLFSRVRRRRCAQCGQAPGGARQRAAGRGPFTADIFNLSSLQNLKQVVDRIEALLRLKRFTQLGGLQLDRNIRDLVTSLADVTQRSVREKFARLTQVATLLSCESMGEVQEFFGPDAANAAYTWRLSDTQIREVLSQRHDFSQGEIARLVL